MVQAKEAILAGNPDALIRAAKNPANVDADLIDREHRLKGAVAIDQQTIAVRADPYIAVRARKDRGHFVVRAGDGQHEIGAHSVLPAAHFAAQGADPDGARPILAD